MKPKLFKKLCKSINQAKKMKYYEIIHPELGVIGCISKEVIDYYAKENNRYLFGEISERDMDRYGDNSWVRPISKKRFKVEFVVKMVKI